MKPDLGPRLGRLNQALARFMDRIRGPIAYTPFVETSPGVLTARFSLKVGEESWARELAISKTEFESAGNWMVLNVLLQNTVSEELLELEKDAGAVGVLRPASDLSL